MEASRTFSPCGCGANSSAALCGFLSPGKLWSFSAKGFAWHLGVHCAPCPFRQHVPIHSRPNSKGETSRSPKEIAVFPEQMKLLLVCVNKVFKTMATYDAARYSWPVKPEKTQQAKYVMAVFRGDIVSVFEAKEWLPANEVNFFDLPSGHGNWQKQEAKFGFVGHPAPKDIEQLYCDKEVPKQWRFTGNSIRYVNVR